MAAGQPKPDPARFQASRATLLVDRFMTGFIEIGGAIVITAVLGIFVFILSQVMPLMRHAKVEEIASHQLPRDAYVALGADEWSELPFAVSLAGHLRFIDVHTGAVDVVELGRTFTAVDYNSGSQQLVGGTTDGQFAFVSIEYEANFDGNKRKVRGAAEMGQLTPLGETGLPVKSISYGGGEDVKLVAAILEGDSHTEVRAVRLARKRTLLGAGEMKVDKEFNLSSLIVGTPATILVNAQTDGIVITSEDHTVYYFFRSGDDFELRQAFKPFGDLQNSAIASIDFLFGDVSLVVTGESGENRVFSLYLKPGEHKRTFGHTKSFPRLPGAASFYTSSLRNKAFLTGSGRVATLRYSTTEEVRWERELPFVVDRALIGGKYDRLIFLDKESKLHLLRLNDPHPETSLSALFGKVWYEGYREPSYDWQSTGGTDEFEPKLSLVPLIVGTFKGTLYAMLFAVPIALTAALYTSQFLHPKFKVLVKPAMEIMASLPSVVLGFLAALWLAPLIETRVPSIIGMVVLIPVTAMTFGYLWSLLPIQVRRKIRPGYEFFVFFPILLFVAWGAWHLGPVLERVLFVVQDPNTGQRIADFRVWWPHVTGTSFEQRNSLVVGFMMGFAVIPIIFTIAEDALSNVPLGLTTGSLALGASRWQTAMRVVVPTASAGIFSALMVGLGRAVGETMIVVMATGNTPVMNWNIFSGMRTLSANIAVELPEAPHHSTLYRTLFLGAMLLFLMTFLVNTVAEVMRQHLREKYKTV